jgi:hypothetical protein
MSLIIETLPKGRDTAAETFVEICTAAGIDAGQPIDGSLNDPAGSRR